MYLSVYTCLWTSGKWKKIILLKRIVLHAPPRIAHALQHAPRTVNSLLFLHSRNQIKHRFVVNTVLSLTPCCSSLSVYTHPYTNVLYTHPTSPPPHRRLSELGASADRRVFCVPESSSFGLLPKVE